MKKRIVVICPGRGTYTKETLGYFSKYGSHAGEFLVDIDQRRHALGEPTISELDGAEKFKPQLHTKGEHASSLIYACSYADFTAIDQERFEIVAITGNSMGWYLAAAFGEALDWAGAFDVINTMGSMMKGGIIGGQAIYPICDGDWVKSTEKLQLVKEVLRQINSREGHEVYPSIHLGGYAVIGGNKAGLAALLKELPKVEDYPFQLINHAAFHTPLLKDISTRAFKELSPDLFQKPKLPLVDGGGQIWKPYSTEIEKIYNYTLGHQVTETYDFTRAVTVALKEFAPDHLVLLGPGATLGGAIGQILIENNWRGLKTKADFTKLQSEDTFLISMGRPEQRGMIARPGL